MNHNLYARLQDAFESAPERDALRLPGQPSWSFATLAARAAEAAAALAELGVGQGDRVVAQVDKSPETLALYLATLRLGAVYVPLNTAYTAAEMAYFLEDADPRLVVHRGDLTPDVAHLTLSAEGQGSFTDAMAACVGRGIEEIASRTASDLAAIVYTSGTTGRSKGAMLSHGNLLSNAHQLREAWGWRDDDVLLHALPIFHVHGLFIALHCALLGATPTIYLPKFDARTVLELLPEATVLMGVPTFYTRLLALPGLTAEQVAGIRVFISGSAPLTEATFAEFAERTGHEILERYGMSETIINTTNPLYGERVAGTVGFALPGVDVRISNDNGEALAAGEVGNIEVRGENVFSGYWRNPEKTAEEIRENGFFITGDLGTMSEDGRVSIVGRSKDLVISGGYNVYPKEIERLIDELDGIAESAVIGVPHPDFGEAVVAVVVPSGDRVAEDSVIAALADKLARFKQPKRVLSVEELPRNAMGKVQKNALRDNFAELFDGS